MPIARNHAERVAGLANMATHESGGDAVAAFAALADASVALALAAGVTPEQAQRRIAQNFRQTITPIKEGT